MPFGGQRKKMRELILFHGSREGIKGAIAPISRERCDFGRGFYMGENRLQTASLVADEPEARVYTLRVSLPDESCILRLEERDWLYAVLSCRRRVKAFDELPAAAQWRQRIDSYDLVAGRIADDRMNEAMRRFTEFTMTDQGLYACLSRVQYGDQYAAKSADMCSRITILEEERIDDAAFPGLQAYMADRRSENRSVITQEAIRHQRDGLFLNEMIDRELSGA